MLPAYYESVFFWLLNTPAGAVFPRGSARIHTFLGGFFCRQNLQAEDLVDAAYALGVEAWRQRMLGAQAVNGQWEKIPCEKHIFDVMLEVFFVFFFEDSLESLDGFIIYRIARIG